MELTPAPPGKYPHALRASAFVSLRWNRAADTRTLRWVAPDAALSSRGVSQSTSMPGDFTQAVLACGRAVGCRFAGRREVYQSGATMDVSITPASG